MPTVTAVLLWTVVVLVGGLAMYGLGFVVAALGLRAPPPRPAGASDERVLVLVPSHHEGAAVGDTVQALVDQDHAGPIEVRVLVGDAGDPTVAALAARFGGGEAARLGDGVTVSGQRRLRVVATGATAKADKLNRALADLGDAAWVAFLDADHRAAPDWISSALACARARGARVVQSRRRPLSTLRLVQLWDSTQNHVGNEVLNHVLATRGVAFTGTTALFRADALRGRRFSDCVTEDTWLTWDLACDGEAIAYDPHGCSYEEVAPQLGDFVARRRRWSAGHTRAFAAHLGALGRAPLSAARKLQLAWYGAFYLVPVAVLASLWAQAAYLWLQLPRGVLALVIAASATGAVALARVAAARVGLAEAAIAAVWAAPFATWAGAALFRLGRSEASYHLLSFPFAERLLWVQLATALVPLATVAAGWTRLGGAHAVQRALFVATYPVLLFFDLYAGLLGAWDCARGRSEWSRVRRAGVVVDGLVPEALLGAMRATTPRRARWGRWLWALPLAALVVLANDVLAVDECGEVRPFLWTPLILSKHHAVAFEVGIDKAMDGADQVALTVRSTVSGTGGERVRHLLDGAPAGEAPVRDGRAAATLRLPVGFARHRVEAILAGRDGAPLCHRTRFASTAVIEVRGRGLTLNGEPLLVKGVVASFASPQLHLPPAEGLAQLKALGANAVRVYHQPGPELLDAAAAQQVLVLDQPDDSTWQNVDVTSASGRRGLVRRYRELVDGTEGFPYLLMDAIGNELESQRPRDEALAALGGLIGAVRPTARAPLAYSTYLTFLQLPVDVRGINMLDTGETYWTRALALLQSGATPFVATELGGFVAFHERTPSELRIARLRDQWARLQAAGALGGFVYESHDNWAQSVPAGAYNDPLTPEQPDDTRGLWDHLNQPKLEYRFVAQLFADVEVTVEPRLVAAGATTLPVTVRNRRAYRLDGVRAGVDGAGEIEVGTLPPGASLPAALPLPRDTDRLLVRFSYRTHHGLAARSRVVVPVPLRGREPVVLTPDFVAESARAGRLIDSRAVDVVVPAGWSGLVVNGVRVDAGDGRVQVAVTPPLRPVEDLAMSPDGVHWSRFDTKAIHGGRWWLRFRLPAGAGARGVLLLAGLGATEASLRSAAGNVTLPVHSYRDNLVPLSSLGGGEVELAIDRQQIYYIPPEVPVPGGPIPVEVEVPRVYEPTRVELAAP